MDQLWQLPGTVGLFLKVLRCKQKMESNQLSNTEKEELTGKKKCTACFIHLLCYSRLLFPKTEVSAPVFYSKVSASVFENEVSNPAGNSQ